MSPMAEAASQVRRMSVCQAYNFCYVAKQLADRPHFIHRVCHPQSRFRPFNKHIFRPFPDLW